MNYFKKEVMRVKRAKELKRFGLLLFLVLCTGLLTACNRGDSGGGGDNPATGSTWDEMVWGQGQWG